jgi:tetratricopeptide (TPR) repeat protein
VSGSRRVFGAVLVALATFAAYGRTLGRDYGFVFDDWKIIVENEAIRDLRNVPRILASAFERVPIADRPNWLDPGYRPVRMISHALEYRLFGLDPRGFRLVNILIHVANALFVWSIARALLRPHDVCALTAPAFFVALLFALHPLATEAVAYISGRRDVLFTFFYLAGLRVFLWARERPERWQAPAIVALFLFALGSKEMAVSFPLACLGLDLALGGGAGARARALLHAFLFAIGALAAVFTAVLKNPGSLAGEPVERLGGSLGASALTMARVIWHDLGLVLFPRTLTADYSFDAFPASRGLFDPPTSVLGVAALGLVALALILAWRAGWRREAFFGAFFFVSLGPVSQLIVPHPEPIAERHLYLPAIFLFLLAADLAGRVRAPRGALRALAAALLVAAGLRTAVRNQDWKNDETIFRAAVEAYPRCARANLALADALLDAKPPRTREALEFLDRCVEILEESGALSWSTRRGGVLVQALFERGTARTEIGLYEEAIRDFDRVLAEAGGRADYLHVRLNRAAALRGKGDLDGARLDYEAVLAAADAAGAGAPPAKLESVRAAALVQLGTIERDRGALDSALARFREAAERLAAARLAGEPTARYLMAEVYARRGEVAAAKEALEAALRIDPKFAPAAFTLADLCVRQGELDEAERWARVAAAAAPGERRAELLLADIGLRRAGASGGPEAAPARRKEPAPAERAARLLAAAERAWDEARPHAAAEALEAAVKLDPRCAEAWERLGRLRLSLGEPGAAIAPLRRAIDLDPGRLRALEALAEAEIEAGDARAALATARRAAEGERPPQGASEGAGGGSRPAFGAGHERSGEARRWALLASALEAAGEAEEALRAREAARAIAEVRAHALFLSAARAAARFDFATAAEAVAAARDERAEAALRVVPRSGR